MEPFMPGNKKPLVQAPGGIIVPACPTSGPECAAEWEIPMEAASQMMLKITQPVSGSKEVQFVGECPLLEFSAAEIVKDLGPGTYFLSPSSGIYRKKCATLSVSEAYARRCGWGAAPPMPVQPNPQQLLAGRMAVQATQGPTDPLNLGLIIQTAVQSAVEPLQKQVHELQERSKPANSVADTLALVSALKKDGRTEMMEMFQIIKALQTGSPMPGVEDVLEEKGGDDMIVSAAKSLGEGLARGAVSAFMSPPQQVPAIHPSNPMSYAAPNQRALPPASPQPSIGGPVMTPTPSPFPPEVQAALEPFAVKIRENLGIMKTMIPLGPAVISNSLYGAIQTEEEADALMALTKGVVANGPTALAWIDPSLATDFWANVVGITGARLANEALEDVNLMENIQNPAN